MTSFVSIEKKVNSGPISSWIHCLQFILNNASSTNVPSACLCIAKHWMALEAYETTLKPTSTTDTPERLEAADSYETTKNVAIGWRIMQHKLC